MNPTAILLIQLSIILTFSFQVLGSQFFSHSNSFDHVSQELDALHPQSGSSLHRRAEEPAPEGPPAGGPEKKGGKDVKLSKEEEMASKLFESVIAMGLGLEQVTSLGSSTEQIIQESKRIEGMVPNLGTMSQSLLAVIPQKTDELNKAPDTVGKAAEAIGQALKEIEKKPEDANLIKSHFKTLEKSFEQIINASDGLALAAIPKLNELVNGQGQPKDDGKKGSEAKPAEQASITVAPANEQAKPTEQSAEQQAAAPASAPEQKAIEPIVPDVAVPQQ